MKGLKEVHNISDTMFQSQTVNVNKAIKLDKPVVIIIETKDFRRLLKIIETLLKLKVIETCQKLKIIETKDIQKLE